MNINNDINNDINDIYIYTPINNYIDYDSNNDINNAINDYININN